MDERDIKLLNSTKEFLNDASELDMKYIPLNQMPCLIQLNKSFSSLGFKGHIGDLYKYIEEKYHFEHKVLERGKPYIDRCDFFLQEIRNRKLEQILN